MKLGTKNLTNKDEMRSYPCTGTRGTNPSLYRDFGSSQMLTRFWKLTNAHKMALKKM
jgi:hypothetical protein